MELYLHQLLFTISILLWSVHVHCWTSPTPSMRQRYNQWMAEHDKYYLDEFEREERFQIFKENVEYIDAFNAAGNTSYTLGLNQFSDLTNEERVARFTGAYNVPRVWNASADYEYEKSRIYPLPRTWDWRRLGAITPVKSQPCGNCWAFTGVEEVESINFLATGKLSELSVQEIMDCDDLPGRGGCDGGWEQEVYDYVKHYSLTTEASYPIRPRAETCNNSKKNRERVARVSSFVNMPAFSSDEELMQAVSKRPVAIGIDMTSRELSGYRSGVFTGPCGTDTNHVMQLVGYGESGDGKHWIARNSWGTRWGEGGYIRIKMGTGVKEGLCGVNLKPSYPVY